MNKIYVLIGESCSGKSTLEKKIQDVGLCEKTISVTTRQPRQEEQNYKDYIFVDNLKFSLYEAEKKFVETTSYNMSEGHVRYGTLKEMINLEKNQYICVLNPVGYEQMVSNLGKEKVVGIYIKRQAKERFISYLNREDRDFNKLLKEANTRYKQDLNDFVDIENKVDYVINNDGSLEKMFEEFKKIVEKESLNG